MSEIGNITAVTVGGTAISLKAAGGKNGMMAPLSLLMVGGGGALGLHLAKKVDPEHKKYAVIGGTAAFVAGCAVLGMVIGPDKINRLPYAAIGAGILFVNGVGLGLALGSLNLK